VTAGAAIVTRASSETWNIVRGLPGCNRSAPDGIYMAADLAGTCRCAASGGSQAVTEAKLHTEYSTEPDTSRPPLDIGALCARGAIAGLVAGFTFVLANMWYADAHGKPAIAPFLDISTIFHGSDKPNLNNASVDVVAGLVTHFALSMLFGIVFALGVAILRLARPPQLLLAAALVYGLALYVVNFQIVGRAFFPWFVDPSGPNQGFELWIHPVGYGLFLVPFFLTPRPTGPHH
jgi:hypothetical protein